MRGFLFYTFDQLKYLRMRSACRLSAIVLLLACLGPLAAQHSLRGCVYDKDTKKPLRDVMVLFNFGNQHVATDSLGKFTIVNHTARSPLLFKKLGYSSYHLALESDSLEQVPIAVYMAKKDVNLGEVEITAEKVNPIVKNKSFYIDDYFILPDKNFLLIAYFPGESGFSLVQVDIHNKVISRTRFDNEQPGELFLDCMGNLHLLTNLYARQIVNTSDTTFTLLAPVPRADFDKLVYPCVAKVNKAYFFREYNTPGSFVREDVKVDVNSNAALIYREQDQKKTLLRDITYSKGLATMQREEIAYQNTREQMCIQRMGVKYSPMDILFAYSCIYRKINVPVFLRNDTLIIFDFSDKEIALYDQAGTCLKKTPISEDYFPQYYDIRILFDRVTSRLYVLTKAQNGGDLHLREVNIYTGAVSNNIQIKNTLGTGFQVYDDDIYYILKEHDWDDTSYLYRQRQ